MTDKNANISENDNIPATSESIEQKNKVVIHAKPKRLSNAGPGNDPNYFILKDVSEKEIAPAKEYLDELKRIGWSDFAYYDKQKSLSFCLERQSPIDEHDGNNLTRYANCVRRYINSRNEVLVLDFIPNHEQKTSVHVVHETGEACLINEIRIALNGVLTKQIRGNLYELHAINTTPGQMDVMTGHITRHGSSSRDPWHGDFAPTIKLGVIEPASELHISVIYMKPGRVFTNELAVVSGQQVKSPPDHTCFLHNGFTMYEQPDMFGSPGSIRLRDPMTCAPKVIKLGLYPQPYMDPKDIVIRALNQLVEDLAKLSNHIQKSSTAFADDTLEETSGHYAQENVTIDIRGDELISRIYGFDESIGCIIASNASFLNRDTCTHASSHYDHPTLKTTIIRITAPNVLNLYALATNLAINRTKNILEQFAMV